MAAGTVRNREVRASFFRLGFLHASIHFMWSNFLKLKSLTPVSLDSPQFLKEHFRVLTILEELGKLNTLFNYAVGSLRTQ